MPNTQFTEKQLDVLTLTEPLACVIHAYRRLPESLNLQSALILGGGPIGVLHALEIQRRYSHVKTTVVEPNEARRKTIQKRFSEFTVLENATGLTGFDLTVVATSEATANLDAIKSTSDAGIVLLFSGLNHRQDSDLPTFEGINFETVHRNEEIRVVSRRIRLIGSSGYNHSDIEFSLKQINLLPEYYSRVQTSIVNELHSQIVGNQKLEKPVIETMLNEKEFYMPELKTVFRLDGETKNLSITPDSTLTRARLVETTMTPQPAPGHVRLKMLRASICQTDRRVLQGTKASQKTDTLILGHEGIGQVEAVNPNSSASMLIGKTAVILPHYLQANDDLALRGLGFLSKKMEHLGIHRNGLLATYVDIPESCLFIIDSHIKQERLCA